MKNKRLPRFLYWLIFLTVSALAVLSLVGIFSVSALVGVISLFHVAAGFILCIYFRQFRQAWQLPKSKIYGNVPYEINDLKE